MKFALAGNPNCGKTTLFNALTGSRAHVGNWPGVTVDKREGSYKLVSGKGKEKRVEAVLDIVDLPGIYSLSPYTPEEVVSRNFILEERPDCVINIVDATNLDRNLYLTTQLLETETPVVVALNMMDVVRRNGESVDAERLSQRLGVPVVEISALKNENVDALMRAAYQAAGAGARKPETVMDRSDYAALYRQVYDLYVATDAGNPAFRAVKMIEGDEVEAQARPDIAATVKEAKRTYGEVDFEAASADLRYGYIDRELSAVKKRAARPAMTHSDKIDRVLTHKIWGIPIFLLIMFAVFHLTFSANFLGIGFFIAEGSFDIPVIGTDTINAPGTMLAEAMGLFTGWLGELIRGALENAPAWVNGLICDGLCEGLFAILSFIPQILVLFLFLSILEDSGYMARVAFIMDRAFRKLGLSGKAFMPLLMCFGCAVPGIMATRTLESEKERRLTVMLAPFFSCGAKLPIWATFAAVMFGGAYADLIVFSMYVLGIACAILAAFILTRTALKGETPAFIMELPAYHLPQLKATMIHLWEKLKHYVVRAGTIIAGAIVVIWFLSSFHFNLSLGIVDPEQSMLAYIAKAITWLFVPLGFGQGEYGWMFVVAAFTGLIAKEMVVSTMGVYSGMVEDALEVDPGAAEFSPLRAMIGTLSAPAAFAFMAFNLLAVPCMAAVAAASGELRSAGKLWGSIGFWMLTAYVVAAVVYWVGSYWWIGLILIGLIAAAIVIRTLYERRRRAKALPVGRA